MSPYVKVTSFPHYPNTLRQVMTNYQPPPVWMTLKCTRSRRDMDSLPVPPSCKSGSRTTSEVSFQKGSSWDPAPRTLPTTTPQQLICAAEPLSLSLHLYFGLSGFSQAYSDCELYYNISFNSSVVFLSLLLAGSHTVRSIDIRTETMFFLILVLHITTVHFKWNNSDAVEL